MPADSAVMTVHRLRRPTLLSAPMFLLGLIGASMLVALVLWAVWNQASLSTTFYVVTGSALALTVAGFVTASGCFIRITEHELVDVVGWYTLRRVERSAIRTVRVRAGAWRWFELELDDGSLVTLVGACPAQLPERLAGGARERDLADLDLLLGDD